MPVRKPWTRLALLGIVAPVALSACATWSGYPSAAGCFIGSPGDAVAPHHANRGQPRYDFARPRFPFPRRGRDGRRRFGRQFAKPQRTDFERSRRCCPRGHCAGRQSDDK